MRRRRLRRAKSVDVPLVYPPGGATVRGGDRNERRRRRLELASLSRRRRFLARPSVLRAGFRRHRRHSGSGCASDAVLTAVLDRRRVRLRRRRRRRRRSRRGIGSPFRLSSVRRQRRRLRVFHRDGDVIILVAGVHRIVRKTVKIITIRYMQMIKNSKTRAFTPKSY